jgi:hypothetical protein
MTNSTRFIKCSQVPRVALALLMASLGSLNIAYAEHAVSANESAAASALTCVETWLDGTAGIIATVECTDRARQTACSNHSRIVTTSLVAAVVRITVHVLAWMWDSATQMQDR